MSKSAEAFRTISEVADVLDTPAHVLRFWESRFAQVKPVKRAGGRRYYRPADVALLGGIKRLLHEDGMTIRGVQKLLREQGVRHVAGLGGHDPAGADGHPAVPGGTPALDIRTPLADEAAPDQPDADVTDLTTLSPLRPGFANPLADRAPGAEARLNLQRDREAAQAPVNPVVRGTYPPDLPPEAGVLPAAALLRAMTAYHAAQRRTELTDIYQRLQALHDRRLAEGHRSRT